MRKRGLLTAVIIPVLLFSVGCARGTEIPVLEQVEADGSYDGATVAVCRGGDLTVKLEVDTRIGLEWALKSISNESVLGLTGQKFVPLEEKAASGATGHEVWSFQALSPGKTTLEMAYRQPWQTQFPPEDTFTLDVTVR